MSGKKIFELVIPGVLLSATAWYWWQGQGVQSAEQNRSIPASETWQVANVSDGDTLLLRRSGGASMRVRLCGIDAPETRHGNQPGQPLGNEAKQFLKELIDKGDGTVEVAKVNRDRYGRTVGEVFVVPKSPRVPNQELFLNEEMAKAGYAYHYGRYSGNCPNQQAIIDAEAIARQAKTGVWSLPQAEKPWDYRQRFR